ncbi:malto-oligosyltrehalose synthase [bacterium]|nr:MAG: malto-oligosyltrehalose synthase [bacterium]
MRIPTATYRLQVHHEFTFLQAKSIVGYLAQLGISDAYLSPIFRARAKSTHGYDVLDLNQINPELGGGEGFEQFSAELRAHDMGLLQDIVPNHMAFDGENMMLMDILEKGPDSRYYNYFDVNWNHPYENIRGRLLSPMLGSRFGEALEKKEIALAYGPSGFSINYYQQRLPLKIHSYMNVLTLHLPSLRRKLGGDHPDFIKLLGVLYSLKNLPAGGGENSNELYDQTTFIKRMLWELYRANKDVRDFLDANVTAFNGDGHAPDSLTLLNNLLGEQFYRLAYWKVATEELNYRRFFTINDLISVSVENEAVLWSTHATIKKLVQEGKISGLRIDHIDGLYDPLTYLQRLRERGGEIYFTVEKILALTEDLPSDWPIEGTTGYDFMNYVNELFCDRENEGAMTSIYHKFTGSDTPYHELVLQKKRLIIGKHMAGDVDNLAHLIKRISSKDRHGGDYTLYGLRRALVEILAHYPVYRTYVRPGKYSDEDCDYMKEAVEHARRRNPDLHSELQFIEDFLLLRFRDYIPDEEKKEWVHFVMRFQQFTGPLMAKGFEDTTLYIFNRLISLNEVGSDPARFGIAPEDFHAFNEQRMRSWPHTMNATATHDTKRGEDTRARINVLSEMPREWQRAMLQWARFNRNKKTTKDNASVPDRNDEYLLYQTLVGTYPFDDTDHEGFVNRIKEYMIKAVREAKVYTAWLKPDKEYEDSLLAFVSAILERTEGNQFAKDFVSFTRNIAPYGIWNSLSQVLLKLTSPGVPDFYQGTDLWDFSLVDPDNRRPVDYSRREEYLRQIRRDEQANVSELLKDLLAKKEDGRIKLYLIYRSLRTRGAMKELFTSGEYLPVAPEGELAGHVVSFARRKGSQWSLTVAPRLLTRIVDASTLPMGEKVWHDTRLPLAGAPGRWTNALTGRPLDATEGIRVADALADFPVALLTSSVEP